MVVLLFVSLILFFRHSQDLFSDHGKIPTDFQVYVLAVERMRMGINPYIPTDINPYKYSPGALTAFLLLPAQESAAWIVFKFLSLAIWIVTLLIGVTLNTWRQGALLLLGLVLSWKGLLETNRILLFIFCRGSE